MNTFSKIAIASVIGLSASVAIVSFADDDDYEGGAYRERGEHCERFASHRSMGRHAMFKHRQRDLDLTADQVKTLVSAKLIMRGNDRLQVGQVTQKDENTYLVDIVTVDNSLVRQIEIDRNTGRPARFARTQRAVPAGEKL